MSQTVAHQGALAPGLYFKLPKEIYHLDRAISRSNIMELLDSPRTYWNRSWMNDNRQIKIQSPDMEYGDAFHTLLFEPAEFERHYQITNLDEFDENKEMMPYEQYFAMAESIKALRAGKDTSIFLDRGYPEVTIVFDFNGIRYRTRHDWFMVAASTEFKTARELSDMYFKGEFRKRGLDVQMFLYKLSRLLFKEQFRSGEAHVYGAVDKGFFDAFMAEEMNEIMFIFQRKTEPYPFQPLFPEDDTEDEGRIRADNAAFIYKKYMKEYGINPWPVSEGRVKRFSMRYGTIEAN